MPELFHCGDGADVDLVLAPGQLLVPGRVPHGPVLLQLVLRSGDGGRQVQVRSEAHVDTFIRGQGVVLVDSLFTWGRVQKFDFLLGFGLL